MKTTAAELHKNHFPLLRLAKLRGLKIRKIGQMYAVTSHSRRADNFEWIVSPDYCSCPSRSYCTHRALVVDHYFTAETAGSESARYLGAGTEDFGALRQRVWANALSRNDRIYFRACVRYAREKRARVCAPSVKRVETVERGRVRVREFVNGLQV